MARDIVTVRKVGGTLVVTLTQGVLAKVEIKAGDKVLIEAAPPKRIIISKEEDQMPTTKRTELELDLLEKQKAALHSEMQFAITQHNLGMPVEPGMEDDSILKLRVGQLEHESNKVDLEIARKRLELFDLQGA